mmetsp:Transcript_8354/g.10516  ORF Transcript_8354/g.10516 Transcript_8354/m.10516 type:complete len:200 (-) Transcript_8354:112-711(-)
MASNSSKTITWSAAMVSAARSILLELPTASKICAWRGGGSSNNRRKFASELPTNLSRISGPLTTVIGRAGDNNPPSFRANRVLPHPGSPYNNNPRLGLIPNSRRRCGGAARGVQIRRLIWESIGSSPPIPREEPVKEEGDADVRAVNVESLEAARLAISSLVLSAGGKGVSGAEAPPAASSASVSSKGVVLRSSSCRNC